MGNDPTGMNLACLVTDYLPSPVKILWNSGRVTKGVQDFPEMLAWNGLYTQTSLLTIPDGTQKSDSYRCDVTHTGSRQTVSKTFPQKSCAPMMPPQVHLLVPSCEDRSTESQLELVCLLLTFQPGNAEVRWLVNGKLMSRPAPAFSSAKNAEGAYMGQSPLKVTRQSWEKGDVFSCQVTHPAWGTEPSMYNTSKCLACPKSALEPNIYMTKPAYEDMIKNSGRMTCLVTGYELAATTVTWMVNSWVSYEGKTDSPKKNINGTSSLVSSHPVSQAQWTQGTRFTCKVSTLCSTELTQELTTINKGVIMKEPSITISKDYHEDITGNRVSVTLVCEVSGFSPEDISISWLKNNSPVLKSRYNNGPVTGSGTFSAYSILKVDQGEGEGNYACMVRHPALHEPKSVVEKVCFACGPMMPPQVHFLAPSCEDGSTESQLELVCLLLSFRPGNAKVTWLVNGKVTRFPTTAFSSSLGADGAYMGQSHVSIIRQSWEKGDIFSCQVTHPAWGTQASTYNISKCLACPKSALEPNIYLTKPAFKDVIKNSGHVTCLVLGYDLASSTIIWEVDGSVSSGGKTEAPKKNNNGTTSLVSSYPVSRAQWGQGTRFTCKVSTLCSGELTQEITMVNKGIAMKEPSVTISRDYHEDNAGNRVSVTLVCEASGFFPEEISISWLKDNSLVLKSYYNNGPVSGSGTFSAYSILKVDQGEGEGSYACMVHHPSLREHKSVVQKVCFACGPMMPPQVQLLAPSCEGDSMESQLELVCLLLSFRPGNAEVKWLINGKATTHPTPAFSSWLGEDGVYMGQSRINVTKRSWDQGEEFTCQVTHPAGGQNPSMQKTSKCLACPKSSLEPAIYLYKPSYEDVIKNSGHVTCLVLGYDLAATTITWEVDGRVSSVRKTEAPKKNNNGTTSLVSSHPVSQAQWGEGTRFTCKVSTLCSGELTQEITMVNKDVDKKEPSITISKAYHENLSGTKESLTLICEASGFYPKDISISWLKDNSPELTASYKNGPLAGSGAFSAYSILKVNRSEEAENCTCVVHHPALEEPKSVMEKVSFSGSDCHRPPPKVFLLPPSLEDLYIAQNATITCVVNGMETPSSLEISWSRSNGGPLMVNSREPVPHPNGTYSAASVLRVCVEEWQSGEEFICTVKHQDIPSAEVKTIHKSLEVSLLAPSVYVFPPHAEELALQEWATITCLASGFRPRDILVTWTRKDRPLPQEAYINIGPMREAGEEESYFIYSKLRIQASEWQKGDTYSCMVGHEGLPMTFTQQSVDKASGKPTVVNVSVVLSDTDVTCH
ncbi:uncharacterized protein LOC102456558 [Pelodiscus sinensis]|uniref:uncharacterized protein LOC102456558 n=1 Tax=Pelodiscus sinensis TaxID=13735 RepID=UPI003F6A5707